MSLENIIARAELERYGYHELSEEQLRLKVDPEALLERGIRLLHGIGLRKEGDNIWKPIFSSAVLGHPVALALCFRNAKGVDRNAHRAVELLRDSASRGHVPGN